MRLGIMCILLGAATAAFSQDLPSYAAASANPKTVVDYFLLCPAIGVDDQEGISLSTAPGMTEELFIAKEDALRRGFTDGSVAIDIPNGYLRVTGGGEADNWALTFVFFDRKGKSDIPAYSFVDHGMEGSGYEQGFFVIDKSGAWKDITVDILPDVTLQDFDMSVRDFEVQWEYALPRKGTTVLVTPRPTSGQERQGEGPDYETVYRLGQHSLQLLWDRVNGRFTKGALQ
jgi:hypothetical protein